MSHWKITRWRHSAAYLKRSAAALPQIGRHRMRRVARQGQAACPKRGSWWRPPDTQLAGMSRTLQCQLRSRDQFSTMLTCIAGGDRGEF